MNFFTSIYNSQPFLFTFRSVIKPKVIRQQHVLSTTCSVNNYRIKPAANLETYSFRTLLITPVICLF